MNNNVYVRSNKSIRTISVTRILFLIPLIIFGCYKNGLYLYLKEYVTFFEMFRPLIFILGGAFLGALTNIIYEKVIKKSDENMIDILFSSFHIEYGILIGCISSINTNLAIYFGVVGVLLFISKFLRNRINTIAFIFISIYALSNVFTEYTFLNTYESSKAFSLTFMDYMVGRGVGGIASTHIILLLLALFGLFITNNNKTSIALSSILTFCILAIIYSLITNNSFVNFFFQNNYLFIFSYIATDSVSSSYTIKGMWVYGILLGVLTFALYFLNPIIAPFVALLLVSLFNNLIDRGAKLLPNS